MKKKTKNPIRELRRIIGRTQSELAATVGVSKDAVVSWEVGRNQLSESFAQRTAFATGAEAQSLLRGRGPLMGRDSAGRRVPFTQELYEKNLKSRIGRSDEEIAWEHAKNCTDALEILFVAAAKAGKEKTGNRLPALVVSFVQWCKGTAEDFQLAKEIDAELEKRTGKVVITHPYGQWRQMQKEDPGACRFMGFKDDPEKSDRESLTLEAKTVPIWSPGYPMRSRGALRNKFQGSAANLQRRSRTPALGLKLQPAIIWQKDYSEGFPERSRDPMGNPNLGLTELLVGLGFRRMNGIICLILP